MANDNDSSKSMLNSVLCGINWTFLYLIWIEIAENEFSMKSAHYVARTEEHPFRYKNIIIWTNILIA